MALKANFEKYGFVHILSIVHTIFIWICRKVKITQSPTHVLSHSFNMTCQAICAQNEWLSASHLDGGCAFTSKLKHWLICAFKFFMRCWFKSQWCRMPYFQSWFFNSNLTSYPIRLHVSKVIVFLVQMVYYELGFL